MMGLFVQINKICLQNYLALNIIKMQMFLWYIVYSDTGSYRGSRPKEVRFLTDIFLILFLII